MNYECERKQAEDAANRGEKLPTLTSKKISFIDYQKTY